MNPRSVCAEMAFWDGSVCLVMVFLRVCLAVVVLLRVLFYESFHDVIGHFAAGCDVVIERFITRRPYVHDDPLVCQVDV